MYAIVKTGGKQYKVAAGDKINIEKLDAEVGDVVTLPALLIVDGKAVATGEEALNVPVTAKVVEQFKGEKVFVVKFHKRKDYKRKNGHRQLLTRVEILSIGEAAEESTETAE